MNEPARLALGQGPPGREFSGRVVSDSSAPSRRDSRVLQFCSHRRRHRRPRVASAGAEARAARPPRSGPPRRKTTKMRSRCGCAARSPSAGLSPRHAQDLLAAFKLDVTKLRYRDWDDLIGYCSLSAMPVGRFVLRRPRREPRGLAGQRRAVRGVADHQSSAGLQGRLSQSRPGLCPAGCACRVRRRASRRSARRTRRRRCSLPAGLAERTERLLSESDVFAAPDQRCAARPRSLGHQHAGASAHAHAQGARSAERSGASCHARGRRLDAGSAFCAARRGGSAGAFRRWRRSRGVRE